MIMKIPNSSSSNGYFSHDSSVISYLSDGSDVGNGEEVDSPTIEGDFSEYMWMENEEEFDKQVMQQLEEEALMEQCIEAMLEDERELRDIHNQVVSGNSNGQQPWSTGNDYIAPAVSASSDLCQTMENLSVQDDLAKQSTLNPNAAEFVPQRRSATESSPTATLQSKTS